MTPLHTTIILPHSHHCSPRFHPFPCQSTPRPPSTPLNTFLLHLLTDAKQHIYIQTPNLTSPPVASAIFDALRRGVDVTIVTSRNMMVLEQLVTAGTTTSRCCQELMQNYETLTEGGRARRRKSSLWQGTGRAGARSQLATAVLPSSATENNDNTTGITDPSYDVDLESQRGPSLPSSSHSATPLTLPAASHGKLSIYAFNPRSTPTISSSGGFYAQYDRGHDHSSQPTHSHLKLIIVDSLITVLGSGNLDRASWYTSQELGLAVVDGGFAERVRGDGGCGECGED